MTRTDIHTGIIIFQVLFVYFFFHIGQLITSIASINQTELLHRIYGYFLKKTNKLQNVIEIK